MTTTWQSWKVMLPWRRRSPSTSLPSSRLIAGTTMSPLISRVLRCGTDWWITTSGRLPTSRVIRWRKFSSGWEKSPKLQRRLSQRLLEEHHRPAQPQPLLGPPPPPERARLHPHRLRLPRTRPTPCRFADIVRPIPRSLLRARPRKGRSKRSHPYWLGRMDRVTQPAILSAMALSFLREELRSAIEPIVSASRVE